MKTTTIILACGHTTSLAGFQSESKIAFWKKEKCHQCHMAEINKPVSETHPQLFAIMRSWGLTLANPDYAHHEWLPVAKRHIFAQLRKAGYKRTHKSKSGSCYYEKNNHRVRISDHNLPATPERDYNNMLGRRCAENEIVLDKIMHQEAIQNSIDEAIQ